MTAERRKHAGEGKPGFRLLIVEDSPADAALIVYELERAGLDFSYSVVRDASEFRAALAESWDVVLSDFSLPGFDAYAVLDVMHAHDPGAPVIVVSGAIGEEIALECVRRGALDYVLKDRLGRLGSAVMRAIDERAVRQARRRAEHERDQALADLSEREAHYRLLVETSPDAIVVTKADGTITMANPTAVELVGVSRASELVGTNVLSWVPDEDAGRALQGMGRTVDAGRRGPAEYRLRTVNGSVKWCEVNAAVLGGGESSARGLLVMLRDITERKRAEGELLELQRGTAETLALLDTLLKNAPVGFGFVDSDFRFVRVNDELAVMKHLTVGDFLGRTVAEIVPELWPKVEPLYRRALEGEVSLGVEVSGGTAGDPSSLRHWLASYYPVRVGDAIVGVGLVVQDITAIRRAERGLRIQNAALAAAADAIAITDKEGAIEWVNEAFSALTGYAFAECVGANPRVLKSGVQDDAFYREMWRTITGGRVWHGSLVNRRKDGTHWTEEMSITPVRAEGGEITHFIAIKRDMTEHLQLEEQLLQAQKMEAVGRLAGGVAHDFNNLLQSMLSQVTILRAGCGDPESHPGLKELDDGIKRGAALTRQLLLFSRCGVAKLEAVDLNKVIGATVGMLRRLVRENVTLSFEPGPDELPVAADPSQLDQVLMNLVVNATDAMPEGGWLTIRTGKAGARVWFSVEDSGQGIPPEIRDRIFEPFFTTKEAGKGTGLGLSVVHGIVTRHSGHVEVTSEVGRGTTFRVLLPRGKPVELLPSRGADAAVSDLPAGAGERVLIIEDESGARAGLAEMLRMLGYEVVPVGSGEEARKVPSVPPFDLLLSDLMLPDAVGSDLVRSLAERWPDAGIIMMSGYPADQAIRDRAGARPVRFLQKPFDLATLAREVRSALEHSVAQV